MTKSSKLISRYAARCESASSAACPEISAPSALVHELYLASQCSLPTDHMYHRPQRYSPKASSILLIERLKTQALLLRIGEEDTSGDGGRSLGTSQSADRHVLINLSAGRPARPNRLKSPRSLSSLSIIFMSRNHQISSDLALDTLVSGPPACISLHQEAIKFRPAGCRLSQPLACQRFIHCSVCAFLLVPERFLACRKRYSVAATEPSSQLISQSQLKLVRRILEFFDRQLRLAAWFSHHPFLYTPRSNQTKAKRHLRSIVSYIWFR